VQLCGPGPIEARPGNGALSSQGRLGARRLGASYYLGRGQCSGVSINGRKAIQVGGGDRCHLWHCACRGGKCTRSQAMLVPI
jgi:hypothetical protein